jgi:Icc-related predicted phosphoesterase
MRLLAFSDVHRNQTKTRRLAEQAPDVDVVVAAGDFASMHRGLEKVIDLLVAIETPTVLVPGNNETEEELREACAGWRAAHVLHGQGDEIAGVQFFGLGAGVPVTPFPFSFDLTEEQAAGLLSGCPEGAVLVSHSPPKGYVDGKRHLGSTAVLRTIQERHPSLVVCGHIHASAGQEAWVGATRVVNAGPDGVVLEL